MLMRERISIYKYDYRITETFVERKYSWKPVLKSEECETMHQF